MLLLCVYPPFGSNEYQQAIMTGPKRDNFNGMCTRHTHQFVDVMAGSMRPLVEHMIGEKEFVDLKDEIAQQMIENLPVAIRCVCRSCRWYLLCGFWRLTLVLAEGEGERRPIGCERKFG